MTVVALAAPILLGLALAAFLAPPARRPAAVALWLGLAVPVTLGAASLLRFGWLLLAGPSAPGFAALQLGAAVVVGGAAWARRQRHGAMPLPVVPETPAPRWQVALATTGALTALLALAFSAAGHPHGRSDAVMIYNMRARFVLRAGEHWRDAFSPIMTQSHPDYPPHLPLAIESLWRALGSETIAVPIAVALCSTAAIAALVGAGAALARGPALAPVALAAVVGFDAFMTRMGAGQLADVPLTTCFTAAFVALGLRERTGDDAGRAWLPVVGAATALAAWTKNEGLLFAVAVGAGLVAAGWRRGPRALAADVGLALAGALPVAVGLVTFKLLLAPDNDLFVGQASGTMAARALSPSRWWTIAAWTTHGLILMPIYVLAGWVALSGVAPGARKDPALRAVVVTLAVVLAGYLAVFLITPLPLAWQLEVSISRLLLHVWPAFVWVCVLLVRGPHDPAEPG